MTTNHPKAEPMQGLAEWLRYHANYMRAEGLDEGNVNAFLEWADEVDQVRSQSAGPAGMVPATEDLITGICRDVAELPDRNSPEDWPEAMLVTADELEAILRERFATPSAAGSEGAEPMAIIRTWHADAIFSDEQVQHAVFLDWTDAIRTLPDGEHKLYAAHSEGLFLPLTTRIKRLMDCADWLNRHAEISAKSHQDAECFRQWSVDLDAALRPALAPEGKGVAAPRRWPFVETPGQFTERLAAAIAEFGMLLPAVRYVLIETPPTIAALAASPSMDVAPGVGLSSEQVAEALTAAGVQTQRMQHAITRRQMWDTAGSIDVMKFARAIERAHGILPHAGEEAE